MYIYSLITIISGIIVTASVKIKLYKGNKLTHNICVLVALVLLSYSITKQVSSVTAGSISAFIQILIIYTLSYKVAMWIISEKRKELFKKYQGGNTNNYILLVMSNNQVMFKYYGIQPILETYDDALKFFKEICNKKNLLNTDFVRPNQIVSSHKNKVGVGLITLFTASNFQDYHETCICLIRKDLIGCKDEDTLVLGNGLIQISGKPQLSIHEFFKIIETEQAISTIETCINEMEEDRRITKYFKELETLLKKIGLEDKIYKIIDLYSKLIEKDTINININISTMQRKFDNYFEWLYKIVRNKFDIGEYATTYGTTLSEEDIKDISKSLEDVIELLELSLNNVSKDKRLEDKMEVKLFRDCINIDKQTLKG